MYNGGRGCPGRADVQMEDVENDLSNFWCHQCGKEIIPVPGPRCPDCQGDFIEEMAPPAAPPQPAPPRQSSVPRTHGFSFRMGGGSAQGPFFQVYQQPLFVAPSSVHADVAPDDVNFSSFPFPFMPFFGAPRSAPTSQRPTDPNAPPMELLALQNFISELLGASPFVGPNEAGFGGGSWEQLLNQLFEQGSGRHGPPPASKAAVASLPVVTIGAAEVDAKEECAICKDAFELNDTALRLPCRHLYHKQCISPWLDSHNSCPVCRFELPTDDQDYEARRQRCAAGRTPASSSAAPAAPSSGPASAGTRPPAAQCVHKPV